MYNKIILVGYLTKDIDLKYSPTGTAIAKSSIATNKTYIDARTKEKKQETLFIDFTIFNKSAEIANQYLKKGSKVLVEGRLILEQWVNSSGQKRYKHSVIVEKLHFMDAKKDVENSLNQQNVSTIDIDEKEIPF